MNPQSGPDDGPIVVEIWRLSFSPRHIRKELVLKYEIYFLIPQRAVNFYVLKILNINALMTV